MLTSNPLKYDFWLNETVKTTAMLLWTFQKGTFFEGFKQKTLHTATQISAKNKKKLSFWVWVPFDPFYLGIHKN